MIDMLGLCAPYTSFWFFVYAAGLFGIGLFVGRCSK